MGGKQREVQLGRLYDYYASNLQLLVPNSGGAFACPLCLRGYDKTAIADGTLTREHIIPSSMRGEMLTLTCKSCNNTSGSRLEAHLKQEETSTAILTGDLYEPIRGKIFVGDGEQTADFWLSEDRIQIDGIPELSNPALQAKLIEAFRDNPESFKVKLDLGYLNHRTLVARIRIAYLLMFRHFGYGYVLNPHLDQIRKLIAQPEPDSEVLKGLFRPNSGTLPNGVGLVKAPSEIRSFICVVVLPESNLGRFGMLFPGFDEAGGALYSRLRERWNDEVMVEDIEATMFPYREDQLIDPGYVGSSLEIWRHYSAVG